MKKLTPMDLKLINEYSLYLREFSGRALNKFIKGRIEHVDQDPMKIDCDEEIEQENMDIIAYQFLKTKQQQNDKSKTTTEPFLG